MAAALATAPLVAAPAVTGAPAELPAPAVPGTYDDILAAVASEVPGFAGAWVENGALAVGLVHPRDGAASNARHRLAGLLGRPDLERMDVVVRPARFAFDDLKAWHDSVSVDALALPGVASSDVDERANVVRIGTSDLAGTEARIRAIAAAHHVPPHALVVEHADPVVEQLREHRSPAVGGIEISWVSHKGFSIYQCTLGFPAVRDGVLGYVTNSHCTSVRASVDQTVHEQPAFGPPIGHEIADPPHVAGGPCPTGRLCRYSDSSFHSLHVDALYDHGRIARPAEGTMVWNGVDRFRVTGEAAPLAGETLTKVGRTSGRTSGPVRATCKTFNVMSVNLTMLCQGQADYSSSGGDSGSPVFAVTSSPSTDDVTLKGIHWGSGGVFSPIDGIQRPGELGPLATCASGFAC
jgi:hypothetical protein